MADMKFASSKQMAGYMQARKGTRPYRVDTLLKKEGPKETPWSETPPEESGAKQTFESDLASTLGGDEFKSEGGDAT